MNTPETINIEKYAHALNNLIGVDSAYLAGDKDVDAIVEVIVAAKKLENRVKELTQELKDLEEEYDRVYEQAEADICGNIADGGTSCHWCMDKTKTDTVRKMQDRLKERGYIPKPYGVSKIIDEYDIDQVAKEMLEAK